MLISLDRGRSWRTQRVNRNRALLGSIFDRRLKLEFHGSSVTSDAGLLAYRELDETLGLSTMAGDMLADAHTGRNRRHALVGMLRQSVFGRLAGYEDVNDADRLGRDPATSLREKRVKIGAKIVTHARYVTFQMAEVAVPNQLFQEILRLIDGLRPRPAPA